MSLQLPVLDDTDFVKLVDGALEHLDRKLGAEWSAAPEGDPGRMLVEVMAYLTDQTVYRLNRLPLKVYIAFLRLLGYTLAPPTAAEVRLQVVPGAADVEQAIEIELPRGTRISTEEGSGEEDVPVFVTLEPLRVPLAPQEEDRAGGQAGLKWEVRARHCAWLQAQELGVGTGLPGLTLSVPHPPIVAAWGDPLFDVRVWVETPPQEGGHTLADRPDDARTYAEWTLVPSFGAGNGAARRVFCVDRTSGTIRFAPAVHARLGGGVELEGAVPARGAQILVSYAHGGGAAGNLLPGTLTRVLDPVERIVEQQDGTVDTSPVEAADYLTVANPDRAEGGRDGETLDEALLRAPQALYTGEQAVTARDYERIILRTSATSGRDQIARARALTQAARWTRARPGTVEIQLVPRLAADQEPRLELLHQLETEVDLSKIRAALAERAAIGTHAALQWAHYKRVSVETELLISDKVESPAEVEDAVRRRLERLINPLHDPEPLLRPRSDPQAGEQEGLNAGWPFGRALQLDEVEAVIKDTPGVVQTLDLELNLDAPNADVRSLVADPYQPETWYASSGDAFYRSLNDGLGWERMRDFAGETIRAIRPNPDRAGLLALVTSDVFSSAGAPPPAEAPQGEPPLPANGDEAPQGEPPLPAAEGEALPALPRASAGLYISTDHGRTWTQVHDFNYGAADVGWLLRANRTILLVASDEGLYEFELTMDREGAPRLDVPTPVPVDSSAPNAPLYALSVMRGRRGQARVAVALKSRGGVYLSDGADLLPDNAGLRSIFQRISALDGRDVRHLAVQHVGLRSYLWAGAMAEGNQAFGCYRWRIGGTEGRWYDANWEGGSCRALAFDGAWVYAATQWGGVLKLAPDAAASDAEPAWQTSTERDTELEPSIPKSFWRFERDQRPEYEPDYRPYKPLWALGVGSSRTVMAGGEAGILRRQPSPDGAMDLYEESSATAINHRSFRDRITLPYDGLFVSGTHRVTRGVEGGEG
jgi:hypothetical protein